MRMGDIKKKDLYIATSLRDLTDKAIITMGDNVTTKQ